MLNNVLNVQENRSWAKNVVNLLHKVLFFQNLCNYCVNDQQI